MTHTVKRGLAVGSFKGLYGRLEQKIRKEKFMIHLAWKSNQVSHGRLDTSQARSFPTLKKMLHPNEWIAKLGRLTSAIQIYIAPRRLERTWVTNTKPSDS